MTVLVGISANVEYALSLPDSGADKINLSPDRRTTSVAGSSCNVAIALQNAGVESVKLLVTTGDDANRSEISAEMARRGLDAFLLPWRDITNVSYLLNRGGESQLLCYKGNYLPEAVANSSVITGQVQQVRPSFRVGTGVQIADAPVIATMFGEIRDDDGNLIQSTNVLNPGMTLLAACENSEDDFTRLQLLRELLWRTNILVVNQAELDALLSSMNLENIAQLKAFGPDNCMKVLVTRSQDGAVYYNGKPAEIPVSAFDHVDVVDPVGAGDCFLGYFIAMLVQDAPIQLAMETAAAASAITVGQVGGSNTPKMAKVQEFLSQHSHARTS